MSGVMNPGRRDTGLLSTVAKGLEIADKLYGIRTRAAQLEALQKENEAAPEDDGLLSKDQEMTARSKFDPASEGEAGSFLAGYVKGRDGKESPLWMKAKAVQAPALRPPSTRAITTVENGKPVVKIVEDKAGQSYPAYQKPEKPVIAAGQSTGNATKDFQKDVPVDQQNMVKALSTKNASKVAIANQMESYLNQFNAAGTEDEKIAIGRQMLKVLNSPEGADAIGAEEANRLGSFLEYKIANITGPGSMFGRDLDLFGKQTESTINAVRGSVKENQNVIDKAMGRESQPSYKPGTILKVGEKLFRVGADGDTLDELPATGAK